MPYFLLLCYLMSCTFMGVTTKKTSTAFSYNGFCGALIYTVEVSICSLLMFWALNSFKLNFSSSVWICGAIFGVVITLNTVVTIFTYNYASLMLVKFISSTVSIILSAVLGLILFKEAITPDVILSATLMLICISVVFWGSCKTEQTSTDPDSEINTEKKKKIHPLSIMLPVAISILAVGTTIIQKYYMESASYTDTNSLFFTCNLFSLIFGIPILLFAQKKNGFGFKRITDVVLSKSTLLVFAHTGLATMETIIGVKLIATMHMAVYTPVVSAIGFISVAIASVFIKEKLDKYSIIATVIAILSIALPEIVF